VPQPPTVALTRFAGRAGDRNDRAMAASAVLADELAARLGVDPVVVGAPESPLGTDWRTELAAARPALEAMAERYAELLAAGRRPVTALSRCAVALATLPAVAAHRPGTVVLWFDAHGDVHTPATTGTGYLGGLALSGPLGLWDSGLGAGLAMSDAVLVGARDLDPAEQALVDDGTVRLLAPGADLPARLAEVVAGLAMSDAVLVGARDLDPAEQALVDDGTVRLLAPGADLPARLAEVVAGRPVYVHLDCDVLAPDEVPTEYRVPGGLTLAELRAALEAVVDGDVVGLEVGEIEATGDPERDAAHARALADALAPVLAATTR
jgi:arginase family enzyme